MITPDFQFDEALHAYVVDNQLQPHVTGILEQYGVIDYSGAPEFHLMRKSILGTAVHKITHWADEDGIALDYAAEAIWDQQEDEFRRYEITAPDLLGYGFGWLRFLQESSFTHFAGYCERRHVATVNGMRYGMTIDRAGKLRGRPTILDLKCTAGREPSWPIQLAGYALGLPKLEGVVRWDRGVVWLKPDGKYQFLPGGRRVPDLIEERRDEEVFLAALRLTHWKQEHYGRFV